MIVNTTGVDNFELMTICNLMTYIPDNYTAYVNFFPTVDNTSQTSTIVYLPQGAGLISYDDFNLQIQP